MDVRSAFLYSDTTEEVYMTLPDVAYKVLGTRDYSKLFLWTPKALFTVAGLWPKIKLPNFISTTYFFIQITYLIFVEIGIYNRIEFKLDKLGESLFGVFYASCIFMVIPKLWNCFFKSKELNDIINIIMLKFWPYNLIDNDLKAQLKNFYQIIVAFNITLVSLSVSFTIILIVIPLYQDERSLPFNVKYPFDYTLSPLYEILFVIIVVGYLLVMVCITFGTDLLYIDVVAATSIQFRILQKCVEVYNTKEMININNKLEHLNIGSDQEWYDIRKEYFVKCIKHHQLLLKLTKKVNAFFDNIILLQLAVSTGVAGIMLYNITQADSGQSITNWMGLIGSLGQLLNYCLLGNDLNYQAFLLPNYIFNSEWTKLENKELRGDVIFLIQQTQQLPKLSCYNLYNMNMDLFIRVVKLSFSIFTLLSNMSR